MNDQATAPQREADRLGLALYLLYDLTAKAKHKVQENSPCKGHRHIPPADHHQRKKRIKNSKPQYTFPFLAALRGSH